MQRTHFRRLTSVDEVESAVGRAPAVIMLKQISALDEGCRAILALSPIAAFGYRDAGGVPRTTFVGGTPGFARVHSPTRISFAAPDVPAGPVSLFFLLPGVGEVLRVNGTMSGRAVRVAEAFVHCAQAVLRSRLWQPPVPGAAVAAPGDGPLSGPGVAGFLATAPFLALSTWDGDGGSDTSPRGDRGTVARILDGHTLAIPDRKGNRRADTLHNLLRDDRLAFAALVPGRTGVLHVSGRGVITDDPALLETMALRGMAPHAALLIDVEHAEVRGNDAVARSRIWNAGTHLGRDTAPDMTVLASRHLAANTKRGGSLLRAIGAIPGIGRLLRPVMNRAYRTGLAKEGYDDVSTGVPAGGVTAGGVTAGGVTAGGVTAADPLRQVRIVEIRRETPSAVTLVLEDPGGTFDFRPGQHFTLVADVGGQPVRRAYSASSAPGSSRLEVTVKQVDGGRFSGHVHRELRAGDWIAVLGPSGTFHLPDPAPEEIVLIAAGSGVTPMMSMIRAYRGRVSLLYSSRSPEEVIFGDALAAAGHVSVTHVLTRRDGRLDAHGVHRWISGLSASPAAHYFVCGPDALMDTVHGVLSGLGIPATHVHQERYSSAPDAAVTTAPQPMTVESFGTVTVEPGQTLLDAGLAAGLPMPYSCTVGNCGDCLVRLRGGEVSTSDPNDRTRPGYVLACLSCPLSPVTVDISEPPAP
ncbi:2Fe-2S iron-sulfur cluster-binding protein [Catenuloplanes indicus]|uniref:Ferredoxin-NADP reductase/predicted pyridoxine 5'-phosphate oxidase superfamily flavin-nucleotide-binding protein n=1 Tax=Catenuloplanes indicus TaxID=137267 RepID=A0AAE4B1Y1_9ACTN|nr:2Fe-2S iron-sulfur cluster-binding protein [Catenuloplanes indicus]MDQ0371102.1 ferredoxin-NADP reductase/predicted pyridoxine 5'-phosphate oxidase superfamily flavin-nucleotide-binding protein [Catenuloplanes indicus]